MVVSLTSLALSCLLESCYSTVSDQIICTVASESSLIPSLNVK